MIAPSIAAGCNAASPFLQTERLDLWLPVLADLAPMHALSDDPETRRFLGPEREDEADTFARLMRTGGTWQYYGYGNLMLRLRGQAEVIGNCGIFHSWRGFGPGMDDVPEAGWIVTRALWGQGLAGEAMEAIIAWFERTHGSRRITCMIEDGHTVSDRLARRLGFRPFGRHRPEDDDAMLVFYERLPRAGQSPH